MPEQNPVVDEVDSVVTSQIGKIVAFVLTPILLPLVGSGAAWAQDILGVNLNSTEVTGLVVSVVVGVALLAWQWLKNRGAWERAVVETSALAAAGQENLALGAPDVPPSVLGDDPRNR